MGKFVQCYFEDGGVKGDSTGNDEGSFRITTFPEMEMINDMTSERSGTREVSNPEYMPLLMWAEGGSHVPQIFQAAASGKNLGKLEIKEFYSLGGDDGIVAGRSITTTDTYVTDCRIVGGVNGLIVAFIVTFSAISYAEAVVNDEQEEEGNKASGMDLNDMMEKAGSAADAIGKAFSG